MKFPATFRQAFVLHFIVVTVVPILLLGLFSFNYFTDKHLSTVSSLLDAHAENVTNEASEFLSDTSSTLHLLTRMIGDNPLNDVEGLSQHLRIFMEQSDSFESIFVLDNNNKVVQLVLSEKNTGYLDDYMGLDMSGQNVFQRMAGRHGPVWSDTFLSTITAEPSITLAIPLKNGFLLGTVSLQKLTRAFQKRLGSVSHGFNFSLLDHRGVVIADSHHEAISRRINLRLHPEVRNALDHGKEVSGKYHEDNTLLESVRIIPETGWVAYVSLPVVEVIREVRPLHYTFLLILSLTTLVGALLSFGMSRHMVKPIIALRDTAAKVARGEYQQTLPPVRYKELESLGDSFLAMIELIHDREQSLMLSEERYRELVNSIDGIVWDLDLASFRFTFVSDHAENLLGYPASRWIEEETFWQDHIHQDDREWVVSYCAMETVAQRDHDFEYRMLAADGRIVWLKDIVSVVSEGGRPVRLSGVMFDITRRKEAELELMETAERMQLLINRMPFGCITWDDDYRVTLWNPGAERIFGYRQEEALGKHPLDFIVAGEAKEQIEDAMRQLDAGDFVHNINENITKEGNVIVCEWHNTPLQNPDGSHAGVISMVDDITKRIDAEEALKESEARFRSVFDTSPDAIIISRLADGKILSANDYAIRVSGYSREELLGKTTLELKLWVDEKQREVYLETLREQGLVENFEMRLKVKSGRERIGLSSARTLLLYDEMCVLNVIRDITEIKEAEMRMARSEARFRSLVSVMGEGILILGFNGEIIQCNWAAERILKRSADEMIGKLHDELDHNAIREDGTSFSEADHPATLTLRTGEPVVNQIMGLPQDDGQIVWVQVNAHALGLDLQGKPNAVVVSFADVTRLKEIENELRESETHLKSLSRQFQGVLEAIPDRILILDRDMRVVWLNWPVDELDPDNPLRCYQLPGAECGPTATLGSTLCDSCPVRRSFESGRIEVLQKELEDGRTLSLRTFPVFSEYGEVVNVIEIAQDITEELQYQSKSMRNAQLASLGELAAGVAHEINNPINGVINYAQLILNKALEDSREQDLSRRIIKESERIATIVRELLYFSREESEESEQVSVEQALNEALALISHQMKKEGILLQLELSEELPDIISRSHQIPRLFLNLISNSRHALNSKYPDGGPDKILRITAEAFEINEERVVRIVFRDHGTGIPDNMLDKILNPFVTTKPSSEGTGLGLSISHEIVQKHKGSINIESVFGEFTEVTVELPTFSIDNASR